MIQLSCYMILLSTVHLNICTFIYINLGSHNECMYAKNYGSTQSHNHNYSEIKCNIICIYYSYVMTYNLNPFTCQLEYFTNLLACVTVLI